MQGYYTKNRALEIQERILSIVNSNINIQGKEIPMSVSMGFAIVPDDTKRYDEAIKIADMRMYQFKKKVKETTNSDIYKKIANS
jgi:GGDEF domain-containing protein